MKEIPLTKGQVALVDDEDYDWLAQWDWHVRWNCTCKQYAVAHSSPRSEGHKEIIMSRFIMGARMGERGDHWDHNLLNNQRENLRVCTVEQNAANRKLPSHNTSGFKGVSWREAVHKWDVRIMANGKSTFIGLFNSKEEGALAYDAKARELHGQFACINFPMVGEVGCLDGKIEIGDE